MTTRAKVQEGAVTARESDAASAVPYGLRLCFNDAAILLQ
jgi:hypothetical protein